ncbi:MAG: hypothetical protein AB7E08_06040 [Candidatus Omnitrophota bacterium]
MSIKLTFKGNMKQITEDINKIISNLSNIALAMQVIGTIMKNNVLHGGWDSGYDLRNTGRFLAYLESEEPKVEFSNGTYRVGFGNLTQLNRITRPPETITVTTPSGRTRTVRTKGSDFPIWLMAEFGIRGLGETPPPEFTTKPKVSEPGFMEYIGERQDTGKPLFLMTSTGIDKKTGKVTYLLHEKALPHRGIRPSRLFRRGLRRVIEDKTVFEQLEHKIFSGLRRNA